MKHFLLALAFVLLSALGGCSSAQQAAVLTVSTDVQAACAEANGLLSLASLVPGAGQVATYIQAGCNTSLGLAKLAADPTSAAWVGQLTQQMKELAAKAGVKA